MQKKHVKMVQMRFFSSFGVQDFAQAQQSFATSHDGAVRR